MRTPKASPQPSPKERGKETRFVNLKSELTKAKELAEFCGLDVYRTRLKCNCQKEFNHRDGILVVDLAGQVIEKVIRCRACVGRDKAYLVSTPTQEGGSTW